MKLLIGALCTAAFLALSGAALAGDKKKDEAKTQGTLTIGDQTYKLTSALAYETKRSNHQRTVITLSEKPLNMAKLKESFKKTGSDEDFFPFETHVKLIFDDKGLLHQTVIYADGNNVNLIGDDNIKATATVKDGTIKGTAGTVKPGKYFKSTYKFELTFDVKLIKP